MELRICEIGAEVSSLGSQIMTGSKNSPLLSMRIWDWQELIDPIKSVCLDYDVNFGYLVLQVIVWSKLLHSFQQERKSEGERRGRRRGSRRRRWRGRGRWDGEREKLRQVIEGSWVPCGLPNHPDWCSNSQRCPLLDTTGTGPGGCILKVGVVFGVPPPGASRSIGHREYSLD